MFFLIAIIFITQLILITIMVSYILNADINILLLSDKIAAYNNWLETRRFSIEHIFSDILFLLKQYKKELKRKQIKLLISSSINTLEWLLLLFIKPKCRKFVIGYKAAKYLVRELSMYKTMV